MSSSYLTQAIHRGLRQHAQRTATICGSRSRTYSELAGRVARLAAGLRQVGIHAGDRVGVLALNSDRYLELYFATWWGGGAINPINIRWSPREIVYSLEDSATRILVVDDQFAPLVPELTERCKHIRAVVHAGDAPARSGMFDYEQLIADHAPMRDVLRRNDDLAGVFYTGGTTGFPKGVMLSHGNLSGALLSGIAEGFAASDDVALHAAPMFHLADGFYLLMLTMLGCTQVIVPAFQPEAVLHAIQEQRVTSALLVPTMIQMLVDHPRRAEFRIDSLRQLIYGASPISESLLRRSMEALPGVRFMQAYGQTEMSPLVTVLPPQYHCMEGPLAGKLRSAGRPASGIEVKIVDADDEELPRGEIGEILARGTGVMQGYWNQPEETAAALREDWMHTGDAAYMDDEGFIFIVDRVKDMIVSGGENVYSVEVENALARHPAVAACAVIGIPDSRWGEAVHAVVVCKLGAGAPDAEALKVHCRELIAGYKCPRSIEFREALPLSGAGKVLKTELRAPYWREQTRRVG